jgi:hypothetical protein
METLMPTFLAAGDVHLNPEWLVYAVVETDSDGPKLRLGFAPAAAVAGSPPLELLLTGPEARSVLRWLRTNAEFLDAGGPSSRGNRAHRPVIGWKTDDVRSPSRAYANATGTVS